MTRASDIASAYSDAFAQANAANNQRYQDILGGYAARAGSFSKGAHQIYSGYNDLLARQALIGDSDRNTAFNQYQRSLGDAKGMMARHGMGSEFLMANAARGAQSDYAQNQAAIADRLAREYAGVDQNKLNYMERTNQGVSGMTKDMLDFKERKNDLGPQAQLYASLAQLGGQADAGTAGFGQGGGGVNMGGGGTRGTSAAQAGFVPPYDQNQVANGLNPGGARTANAQAQTAYNQTIYPAAMNAAAMEAGNVGSQMMGPNFGGLMQQFQGGQGGYQGAMGSPFAQQPRPDYGYGAYPGDAYMPGALYSKQPNPSSYWGSGGGYDAFGSYGYGE